MMFGLSETLTRIIVAALFLALIVAFFSFRSCTSAREEATQARQDAKGVDAYAGAAKEAVAVVVARTDAEADVDEIVAQASKEIEHAEDPAAARAAIIAATCRLRLYSQRPECQVQSDRP